MSSGSGSFTEFHAHGRGWRILPEVKPFCGRTGRQVLKEPTKGPSGWIMMLCCWHVLQKDTFGLREAAIFQKSLDGNQPTNGKHYSSVASALLTNS